MTFPVISNDARLRLAQSMPTLEKRRGKLVGAMRDRLVALEEDEEPFGQGEVTALILTDLLIECARDMAAFAKMRDLRSAAIQHERSGIDSRHYSRFGIALDPVLREVTGPQLSPFMIAALCDAFWLLVRKIGSDRLPRHARPMPGQSISRPGGRSAN